MSQKAVLFVCLGNICRSPSAEGVFHHLVTKQKREHEFKIDSAGTGGWHVGEKADRRMREAANLRGYDLKSRARKFVPSDFDEFDLILAMDHENYENIIKQDRDGTKRHKVKLMLEFHSNAPTEVVPDPYYGGPKGFDYVLDLLEDSCQGLLDYIDQQEQ